MAEPEDRITISLDLDQDDADVAVRTLRGREEVSRPYRYEVELVAIGLDVDALRPSAGGKKET